MYFMSSVEMCILYGERNGKSRKGEMIICNNASKRYQNADLYIMAITI